MAFIMRNYLYLISILKRLAHIIPPLFIITPDTGLRVRLGRL